MIFPGISTATNPFPRLGAGQPPPKSDPPRASIDRSAKRLAAVKHPPPMVRIYVVGLATATMLHRAIHGKPLISVPALPVRPQPRVRFPSHRPVSCLSRWSDARKVQMPGALCRTATYCGLAGRTVHRRAVPGHMSHHRPNRHARHYDRWRHRRRSRRDASTTADAHRARGTPRPDPHSTRRHPATSDPDQEPGAPRLRPMCANPDVGFGRFLIFARHSEAWNCL
jgi:hypothetical protein